MTRNRFLSLLSSFLLLLTLMVGGRSVDAATAPSAKNDDLTLRIVLTRPSYASTDQIDVSVRVNNNSTRVFDDARVDLVLRKKELSPGVRQAFFEESISLAQIPTGDKTVAFSKDLLPLSIPPGSYPFEATLLVGENAVATAATKLVIVNPRTAPPMTLVLVWTMHERAHFAPDGGYLDQEIQSKLTAGDIYRRHLLVEDFPGIKVNFSFSPLLISQLLDIGQGYTLKGETDKRVPKTSPEASQAREVLAEYAALVQKGQAEFSPPPFSYPSLTTLADEGWTEDGLLHVRLAKETIQEAFRIPDVKSFVVPNEDLGDDSLSYFAKNQADQVILTDRAFPKIPGKKGDPFRAHRVTDSKENALGALFADGDGSTMLTSTEDPSIAIPKLMGRLAELYIDQPAEGRTVVLMPPSPNYLPPEVFLKELYRSLAATPWIQTTTASEAARRWSKTDETLALSDTTADLSPVQKIYHERLKSSRGRYLWFVEIIEDDKLEKDLEQSLLVAESSDWTAIEESTDLLDRGFSFLQYIDDTVADSLAKVTITSPTELQEPGLHEILIVIENKSGLLMRAELNLRGENMSFDEEKKRLLVTPGSNRQRLTARVQDIPARATITLGHEGKAIAKANLKYQKPLPRLPLYLSAGVILAFAISWLLLRRKARY